LPLGLALASGTWHSSGSHRYEFWISGSLEFLSLRATRSRPSSLLRCSGCKSSPGASSSPQSLFHRASPDAATFMWRSTVGNTPVGIAVGRSLPAFCGMWPAISQYGGSIGVVPFGATPYGVSIPLHLQFSSIVVFPASQSTCGRGALNLVVVMTRPTFHDLSRIDEFPSEDVRPHVWVLISARFLERQLALQGYMSFLAASLVDWFPSTDHGHGEDYDPQPW
jgi:hypothetical protein